MTANDFIGRLADRVRDLEAQAKAHDAKCDERNSATERRWQDNNARLDRISTKLDRMFWAIVGLVSPVVAALVAVAAKFLL